MSEIRSRSEPEDKEGSVRHAAGPWLAGGPWLTASKGTGSSVGKLQRIAFCQPPE